MTRLDFASIWTPVLVERYIDSILLADKRRAISQEMQVKSLAARISAKNDHQRVNAEVLVVDEWAGKLFQAWLETWDIQGFPKCHALYRTIYEKELRTLFSARRGSFQADQQRRVLIQGIRAWNPMSVRRFGREVDRLSAKWNMKADVESRKSMYAMQRTANPKIAPRSSEANLQADPRSKNAGRKRKRDPNFDSLARRLWRSNQNEKGMVSQSSLKLIAAQLDDSRFSKPSEYLEGVAGDRLRSHNKQFGHSPKVILNWVTLVSKGDPALKTAMRRLLSRCASDIRK